MTNFIAIFLLLFTISACNEAASPVTPNIACTAGIAHIQVIDGAMIRICGCAEPNKTTFTSGQTLTCTVQSGTQIFFDFVAVTVVHQVNITGVFATPVISPSTLENVQIFPIKVTTVGTFPFYDIFFPSIGGNIVVQ